MPSSKAWVEGFIKRGGIAQALKLRVAKFAWLNKENALQKKISLDDQSIFHLIMFLWFPGGIFEPDAVLFKYRSFVYHLSPPSYIILKKNYIKK